MTTTPDLSLNTDAFRRIRATHAQKAIDLQFQRLADIARGVQAAPLRNRFPEPKLPPPFPYLSVSAWPPYSGGEPDPEYRFNATTGQIQQTGPGISEFRLGNARTGRISLGAFGGISFLYDVFTPLTGSWLLGDATAVSASIFETLQIDNVSWPRKATTLACVVEMSNPASLSEFGESGTLICTPGRSGSVFGGFVGVSGALDVTATLFSKGAILVSQSASVMFLELAVNAQKPGTGEALVDPDMFLSCAWLFDSAPGRTIRAAVSLPLDIPADRLVIKPTVVIEATVRIIGARGGVNDPLGGEFAFDFADSADGADPLGFSSAEAFFSIPRITADPEFLSGEPD